jgi:hypothetical protein
MTIYATAGSKLYIGAAIEQQSDDFVAADFTSQTWTEVTGLEGLGSIGDTSQAVTIDLINESRQKTLKGTRSAGNMEVVCAVDPTDAGQLALIAAEKSKSDFAFRLVLNDAPTSGSSPTPSERLFIAKVMSQSEQLDQANSIMKLNATLAVNSNIVRVAAATGD